MLNDRAIAAILAGYVATVAETGKVLRTGQSSTRAAIRDGDIPSFRVGNNIRVPAAWLREKLGVPATEAA
jgi:hypothetical protein